MLYLIQVLGQPDAYGDYLDETEARSVVRRSGLITDMRAVKVTPVYDEGQVLMTKRLIDRWQRTFLVDEFCQKLRIPEEDARYLKIVHSELFVVSARFSLREADEPGSYSQWERRWGNGTFLKRLGLPKSWRWYMVGSWIPNGNLIAIEFIK